MRHSMSDNSFWSSRDFSSFSKNRHYEAELQKSNAALKEIDNFAKNRQLQRDQVTWNVMGIVVTLVLVYFDSYLDPFLGRSVTTVLQFIATGFVVIGLSSTILNSTGSSSSAAQIRLEEEERRARASTRSAQDSSGGYGTISAPSTASKSPARQRESERDQEKERSNFQRISQAWSGVKPQLTPEGSAHLKMNLALSGMSSGDSATVKSRRGSTSSANSLFDDNFERFYAEEPSSAAKSTTSSWADAPSRESSAAKSQASFSRSPVSTGPGATFRSTRSTRSRSCSMKGSVTGGYSLNNTMQLGSLHGGGVGGAMPNTLGYRNHSYHESPASEARSMHVLDNGCVLLTKNAYAVLEKRGEMYKKFSYSEIDTWIEQLRKILYKYLRTEVEQVRHAVQKLVALVNIYLQVTDESDLEALESVLLCFVSSGVIMGQERSHNEILAWLGSTSQQIPDFRIPLKQYHSAVTIYRPLRQEERRSAKRHKRNGAFREATVSTAYAVGLNHMLSQGRLPSDATEDAVYNNNMSSSSGGIGGSAAQPTSVKASELVLGVWMHYWDHKSSNSSINGGFQLDYFANCTNDLTGLPRNSVALVRNEQLPTPHFDVYTSLDDREGPFILECETGRSNCYISVLMFMLVVYKHHVKEKKDAKSLPYELSNTVLSILDELLRSSTGGGYTDRYLNEYVNI